jgi:hypothetical protein
MKPKMEYRLLKTIESSQFSLLPKETLPRLSAYPANNCVNPGLGQIARLYSFYVPLYSNRSLHSISKNEPNVEPNVEAIDQEGTGNDLDVGETKTEQLNKEEKSDENLDDIDLNPIEFNERKRKLLGPAVHESFIHPKLIKTNKIIFPQTNKSNQKNTTKEIPVSETKHVKHKFQFQ